MDFPSQDGTGIEKLIPHIKTPDCIDIISTLCSLTLQKNCSPMTLMSASRLVRPSAIRTSATSEKRTKFHQSTLCSQDRAACAIQSERGGGSLRLSRDETAPSDNGSDGSFKRPKLSTQAPSSKMPMHMAGSSKPRLSIGTSDEDSEMDTR